MCRILVISDIHGNLEDLLYLTGRSNRREYQFLKEEFDRVFLLGDYIGDNPTYCTVAQGDSVLEFIKDYLIDNEDNIILLGNHEQCEIEEEKKRHPQFKNLLKKLPEQQTVFINDRRIHLQHSIGNALPDVDVMIMSDEIEADIILFGHDHQSRILKYDKKILINPGSLWGNLGGYSHTYALLDLDANRVSIKSVKNSDLTLINSCDI